MKIVKIIIGIIISFILVIAIDYGIMIVTYELNKDIFKDAFKVQGNKNKYVPQGLTYSEKYNVVLQTSYNYKHIAASMLYVIDFDSGKLIKELKLKDGEGNDDLGHVGGITTDEERVWITNDYGVNEYLLDEIFETEEDYIKSIKNIKLESRGDFCCYSDGILWIGDFYLKFLYPVKDDTPLLYGYTVNSDMTYKEPSYVISIPKMIQGLTFNSDKQFVFTTSYSSFIHSGFSIYENVLKTGTSEIININGKDIPYYSFDKSNLVSTIKMPPMAEGLFYKDDYYYILFESSSDARKPVFPSIEHVIKYKK